MAVAGSRQRLGYAIYVPQVCRRTREKDYAGRDRLVNKGQPRKLDDWGALRVWAWGASRALDYLETDKSSGRETCRFRRPLTVWQGLVGRDGL